MGNPSFSHDLTADAEKFNAPRHFGRNLETSAHNDDSEILPLSEPMLRRATARQNKA